MTYTAIEVGINNNYNQGSQLVNIELETAWIATLWYVYLDGLIDVGGRTLSPLVIHNTEEPIRLAFGNNEELQVRRSSFVGVADSDEVVAAVPYLFLSGLRFMRRMDSDVDIGSLTIYLHV